MHPIGWALIIVLSLLSLVGWMGRPYNFKNSRRKPKLFEAEELEERK